MDRNEFMELVYETFADEPDNVLANGIIEAADAYAEHEKAQLSQQGTTKDTISRRAALDAIVQCTNCGDEDTLREYVLKHSLDNGWTGGILEALDAVKDLPPAQPEPPCYLGSPCEYQNPDVVISQPEPSWIPVSERLPETTDPVLTTYIVNGNRSRKYVEESSCYGDDEYWCSPWDEYRKEGTRIEVIAWMPEPEPYKSNK